MTSVDTILNYARTEEEDFYGILGCDETATVSMKEVDILCSLNINVFFYISFCSGLNPPPELICNRVCFTEGV